MTTTDTRSAQTSPAADDTIRTELERLAADPPLQPGDIVVGERTYVHNPYMIPALGSMVGFLIACSGTAWSAMHDFERTDLAFGVALAMLIVLVVNVRRFNDWDRV
jgi:hypothetical protein